MYRFVKPKPAWEVVKATSGVTFVQRGISKRFALHFEEGEAAEIAAELNKLEAKIAKLKYEYSDLTNRT